MAHCSAGAEENYTGTTDKCNGPRIYTTVQQQSALKVPVQLLYLSDMLLHNKTKYCIMVK